jgi:hypothetical protein
MTTYSTFGFEAEFENNVEPVLDALHHRGLAGDANLHGYHCRCETCDFDSSWAFRGQSDSSCGGEIISGICDDFDEGRAWMTSLQAVAVDADAEPSLRAGFHVHVGIAPMDREFGFYGRALALWNYLRWENLLGDIASGRWPGVRGFNDRLTSALSPYDEGLHRLLDDGLPPWQQPYHQMAGGYHSSGPVDVAWLEEFSADVYGRDVAIKQWAYDTTFMNVDRHSWLNIRTRNERTFEFRLWNSTRSAWRMEAFVRTSLLFVNPEATLDLANKPVQMRSFMALAERHDPGLKALLKRQLDAPKSEGPLTVMAAA